MKFILISILFLSSFARGADDSEFDRGFSEAKGMVAEDKASVDADRMKIGGIFQGEFSDLLFEGGSVNDYYTNPWTLQMYLDSKLKNDVRAFILAKYIYDPTVATSAQVSPITGLTQRQESGAIDEAKIQFNTAKKVFWTLGLQKIKWGVSKFWNPTDFMNSSRQNYFYSQDFRAGLPLIKAHVPLGNANLYGILLEQTGNELKRTGGATRIEIPFSIGEVSFSALSKYQTPTWMGADFSIGVGDFDIYAEAAQLNSVSERSASGGVGYAFKYNDDDSVNIGVEAYYQANGATSSATLATTALAGTYVPFYFAQFYSMAQVTLLKPGSWNDTSWTFYYIRNNSDTSDYYRLMFTYTGIQDLTFVLSAGLRGGPTNSEMRLGGQKTDASILAKLAF